MVSFVAGSIFELKETFIESPGHSRILPTSEELKYGILNVPEFDELDTITPDSLPNLSHRTTPT